MLFALFRTMNFLIICYLEQSLMKFYVKTDIIQSGIILSLPHISLLCNAGLCTQPTDMKKNVNVIVSNSNNSYDRKKKYSSRQKKRIFVGGCETLTQNPQLIKTKWQQKLPSNALQA